MSRYRRYPFLVLATLGAAAVAAAQEPQSAPPPAANPRPSTSERVGPSDPSLALEVQARLYQELSDTNVSVLVRYGVATLDGVVRADADRQHAEEIALQVPGVDSVVNQLTVAPPVTIAAVADAQAVTERENTDVEDEVAQQLRTDAAVGSRDIRVVADRLTNTITLSGTVSTEDEKERAGQIAVKAFPVGQVRNQLEVRQRL
ncbi:MAG TPA: BON domain-containing protein [Gammaproteobacteria bacterium]|nr:BON domain-containing protein [Gammaproteobacteria bacterium]